MPLTRQSVLAVRVTCSSCSFSNARYTPKMLRRPASGGGWVEVVSEALRTASAGRRKVQGSGAGIQCSQRTALASGGPGALTNVKGAAAQQRGLLENLALQSMQSC